MRYLTYEEYLNIGGTLEKTAFERVIDRVCGIIDFYTLNRLQGILEVSERVKACVRDLCEYIYNGETANGKAITGKTQSAGGVSESESYAVKTDDETRAEMRGIVYDYLASETDDNGTPLLYRGCRF